MAPDRPCFDTAVPAHHCGSGIDPGWRRDAHRGGGGRRRRRPIACRPAAGRAPPDPALRRRIGAGRIAGAGEPVRLACRAQRNRRRRSGSYLRGVRFLRAARLGRHCQPGAHFPERRIAASWPLNHADQRPGVRHLDRSRHVFLGVPRSRWRRHGARVPLRRSGRRHRRHARRDVGDVPARLLSRLYRDYFRRRADHRAGAAGDGHQPDLARRDDGG